MPDRIKAIKVGILVLLAVVVTWVAYRMVDERTSDGESYTVWALFEDAQGLVPKSRVTIAGISVGYIEEIRLSGTQARVDIRINGDIALYKDARISKKSASILGESLLVLYPGDLKKAKLKDGDRIRFADNGAGTDEVLENVNEIAKSIRLVADQMARSFGTDVAGDQMAAALENLSEALVAINRTIDNNEEVITSAIKNINDTTELAGPRIAAILQHVEDTTRNLKETVGNAEGADDAGTVDNTVESIHRATKELEEVLSDVHVVTDRTARGEGTIGRLTSDDALIDEIEGVVDGVGSVVGGISRLQTIVGLRTEYNFLANSFKSYLELRLQPREDHYYMIQLIDDPRGSTDQIQTTVRTSPPPDGIPPVYTETRTIRRNEFRFSLMLAKRVKFMTFRFGILESTGGVGTDVHLFDDRFEFNADMFALGQKTFPRLRFRMAYEFVHRFWVLGGIDDVMNGESRDFFLGAMLRFNDEDLKSILPFVGTSAVSGG